MNSKFIRNLFLCLCLLIISQSKISAQNELDISISFDPYTTPYLSEWESNPSIGQVQITNNTDSIITVQIYLTIEHSTKGVIGTAHSNPIEFPSGSVENISTDNLVDWSSLDYNKDIEEIAIRTGRLPGGEYSLCLRLESMSGYTLIENECIEFTIIYPDPPYLTAPFDGEEIYSDLPIFQWTPVNVPIDFPIHYNLRIVELYNAQNPFHALEANRPHFEASDITESYLQYPIEALALEKGKTYVWQVQVLDEEGYPPSSNNGKSEIWIFVCPADTTDNTVRIISGTVTDKSTHTGLESATIILYKLTEQINSQNDTTWVKANDSLISKSNNKGDFSFNDISENSYFTILAKKAGYQFGERKSSVEQFSGTVDNFNLSIRNRTDTKRKLAGVVRDVQTKEPIPNVNLLYQAVSINNDSLERKATTDINGNFVFKNLDDTSKFRLTASGNLAYVQTEVTGNQYGDIENYVIYLDPAPFHIVGSVKAAVGGDNVPVKNALVNISRTDIEEEGISVYTDAEGLFKINNISPENANGRPSYKLTIHDSKFLPYEYPILIKFQPGITVNTNEHILTAKTGTINGMILCNGEPVSDAAVYLYNSQDSTNSILDTNWTHSDAAKPKSEPIMYWKTDNSGSYVFNNVLINAPEQVLDKYKIWVEADGYNSSCKSGRLENDGDTSQVDFNLQFSLGLIYGQVVDENGDGVSGARVELQKKIDFSDIKEYLDYIFSLTEPTFQTSMSDQNGDGLINISDIVFLIDSKFDKNIPTNSDGSHQIADWVETESDGFYTLNDIDSGDYKIEFSKSGYQSFTTEEFKIFFGDKIKRYDTIEKNFGVIDITVHHIKDKDTTVLEHVTINSQVWTDLYAHAFTDKDGKFFSDRAPVGKIPFRFIYAGYFDKDTLIEIKEGDTAKVEIALKKYTGTLEIRVIDSVTSRPISNFDVIFGDDTLFTNMGGRVTFDEAAVGTDTIKISPPDSKTYKKDYIVYEGPIYVPCGRDTSYTIKMVPASRMSGTVVAKDSSNITKPVKDAVVTIEGNGDVKAKTDKDGKFVLRNVPSGEKITLVAQKAGYKIKRVPGWTVEAGDHIENIKITIEVSPLDSLFGFPIVLDSIFTGTDGKKKATGAIINIPATFGLKLKDSDAKLYFENVILDSLYKPISDEIKLKTSQIDVSVFGFEGSLKYTGGLRLENIHFDSLMSNDTSGDVTKINSVKKAGRIAGTLEIKDGISKFFPNSKWTGYSIPKKLAPSFWAGGINRGLSKYGITADSTEAKVKLWALELGIDYVHTSIDTGGFHFYGSIKFGEKLKVQFENLNIGKNAEGKIAFKAITIKTDPPPQFKLGQFAKIVDSSFTWNETGVWLAGAVAFPKWDKEFGIENVHIRQIKKAPFFEILSARITGTEEKSSVDIYGQKFIFKKLEFGTENWETDTIPNVYFIDMAGGLQISCLDKPVEIEKLKITLFKWDVAAKVSFNQSRTFSGIVTVSLGHIEFDKDEEKGHYIGFSAGIRFGAIKGIELQASDFKVFFNQPPEFERISFGFYAGPTEIRMGVGYSDGVFEGDGFINIPAAFSAGTEFRYGGLDNWWIRIISGIRIPLGPYAEMVQVSGGLGCRENVWRLSLGGRIAPMKADMAVALDALVEVYITPKGPIFLGEANVLVGGNIAVGKALIEINIPERLIAGSIILGIKKGPVEVNAQVDLGVKFWDYWYIHGKIALKLFEIIDAQGDIVLADNWEFIHRGDSKIINGLYMIADIPPIDESGDYFLIGYGLHLEQDAYLTVPWSGKVSGALSLEGNAYAFVGIPGILSARINGSILTKAYVYNEGSAWFAGGRGVFALSGYIGVKCNTCNKVCWKCTVRKWGICWWKSPGARFCRSMDAQFNYNSYQGFTYKVILK